MLVIPLARKYLFPVFVDRRSDNALDDVRIVADRLRRELRHHRLNQFFHSSIVGVGQESAIEEWIALFLECNGGCCFDEVLRAVDSKLLESFGGFAPSDGPKDGGRFSMSLVYTSVASRMPKLRT